jgi:hypothetical protein
MPCGAGRCLRLCCCSCAPQRHMTRPHQNFIRLSRRCSQRESSRCALWDAAYAALPRCVHCAVVSSVPLCPSSYSPCCHCLFAHASRTTPRADTATSHVAQLKAFVNDEVEAGFYPLVSVTQCVCLPPATCKKG